MSHSKPEPKDVWAPREWYKLHWCAIRYPSNPTEAEKKRMLLLFWNCIHNLPCGYCLKHAKKYTRSYPPDFSGSEEFQTYLWRFHNAVNKRLGKPLMSAKDYRAVYAQELNSQYGGTI